MSLNPLKELHRDPLKIKRALLSVYDKKGIVKLAESLHNHGVEIISTGGTSKRLSDHDLPVTDVSELTDFPECLDGRVKTLHPAIHAAILARTSHKPDRDELNDLEIEPIELVVANLYPFEETVAKTDSTLAEATEFIDIGGPTMIRAAAKNFPHVCVLSNPEQYEPFIESFIQDNEIDFETRKRFARDAFLQTAQYEHQISVYFENLFKLDNPSHFSLSLPKNHDLRYGENPHQKAAVYGSQDHHITCLHGKELSYNNYLDLDAAIALITEFKESDPTCAIFKHTVPCGVATDTELKNAWKKAFSTDTISPFGGIIIVNTDLDPETAENIDELFTELVIAPSFDNKAFNLLSQKKNRRLITFNESVFELRDRIFRSVIGGAVSQERDIQPVDMDQYRVVTERAPDKEEIRDLLFAWKVVKHVKSNAIVYARNEQTVGIGTGQTSRVDSSEIAIAKAKKEGLSLQDSVIASDAFFPFADGVEAAAKAGARSIIQPGGSIRDVEVVEMADKYDMAMIFTGNRHFKH